MILALLLSAANAMTVNFTSPPLCNFTYSLNPTKNPLVLKGDKVFLCLYVTAGPQTVYSLTYQVPVDTYSMLQMTGSYAKMGVPTDTGAAGGFYLWTATPVWSYSLGVTTTTPLPSDATQTFYTSTAVTSTAAWPAYCDTSASNAYDPTTTTKTPPLTTLSTKTQTYHSTLSSCPWLVMTDSYAGSVLSLVIKVFYGTIVSLTWDNSCYTCSSNSPECIRGYSNLMFNQLSSTITTVVTDQTSSIHGSGICGQQHTNCTSTTTAGYNKSACDIKVLVTWSGTDRNGNQLTTSGIRLSQFAGASLSSLYESVSYSFSPPSPTSSSGSTVDVR